MTSFNSFVSCMIKLVSTVEKKGNDLMSFRGISTGGGCMEATHQKFLACQHNGSRSIVLADILLLLNGKGSVLCQQICKNEVLFLSRFGCPPLQQFRLALLLMLFSPINDIMILFVN